MVYVGLPVSDLIRWNAEHGECGAGEVEQHVAKRIGYMRAGSPHLFQRIRPDGTVIEMRGRALPGGGYVTTYTDVTAYKHAEQALIEANENLEQRVDLRTAELSEALADTAKARLDAEAANASKTRFLAAASHDLLQPLNAARLFTSALRQYPSLDEESAQLAERIDASFRAAEDLLDALLDVSRLDAGSYRPDISAFSLTDLFNSLKPQFAVVAEQRGIAFDVVPTTLSVRSDPQLLRRIVQNFLSNALRYTRRGRVLMGARRSGDQVRIEVWDTGPGIAMDQQARIFGEFQRLDRPSPWGEKGLGLGLSICERISNILGHRLDLHSEAGTGSCFSVTVPRTAYVAPKRERPMTLPGGEQLPLRGSVPKHNQDTRVADRRLCLVRHVEPCEHHSRIAPGSTRLDGSDAGCVRIGPNGLESIGIRVRLKADGVPFEVSPRKLRHQVSQFTLKVWHGGAARTAGGP